MTVDLHDVLRRLVGARTVSALATTLSAGIATSRFVVLARVWVNAPGGLVLAGSAGTPSGGGSYSRIDRDFREIAVADSAIGAVAQSGRPLIVRGIRGDEDWLINSSWAARQGARAFAALPLVAGDHVAGVLAVFDRESFSEEVLSQLQLVADIAAVRLEDLRAREELAPPPAPVDAPPPGPPTPGVRTREEVRRLEKENIEAALAKTQGKVFGADGAAALLDMKPTTLASRIKALGIR